MDLSVAQWSYAFGVLLLASVVRGLTGFGFSAIIVTGLSLVVAPAQTVMLALFLEVVASVRMLPSAWKSVDCKLLTVLCVGTAIGTPLGVRSLLLLSPDIIRLAISCIVLFFAVLIWRGVKYRGTRTVRIDGVVGVISGVCNGAAALGGLPVVTYMLSTETAVVATRATLIAAFFCTDVYTLVVAGGHGIISSQTLINVAYSVPVLLIGVAVGERLFSVASPAAFKKIAVLLLMGLSIVGIIKSLMVFFV
ncbi:sulfite exporter TauE/SafE family protein [Halodesulfovibrio marinisediminis]|uniref:Probable membrane transporter protein n=1 Tax=Halodesulfovibrio marinisediminis DSM 17456 TaxID=1121457 RepID=A0A1N6H7X5_9BACT|nr:sulfite exporter TauE/SafE family protein [Halodesulfovibrio marinisediminis]SIO15921.1 hypothetical protein SAMN02745161_2061 [Halodesulfovibrio marinisediminis DSM 17456]